MPFDLVGCGRGTPICQLGVIHRDQGVGDHRGQGNAGIKQPEVAGMRNLDLPPTKHLFHIVNDFLQRHLLMEVVTRLKVSPHLFCRYRGQDGAVRNIGLQLREIKPDFVDEHSCFPPPAASLEANGAHLNAFIQLLVEPSE